MKENNNCSTIERPLQTLFYNNFGTSSIYILIISIFFFIAIRFKIMSRQERHIALEAAIQSVKRDKMTFRAAARLHGLAKSSVNRYFNKVYPNHGIAVNESRPTNKY